MRLVFLGSPGVGKGTQAKRLSKAYNIPHVATGDMLRAAIAKRTAVGLEAKTYVESGGLVPDALVIRIVAERLAEEDMRSGFILDGFPRTREQAEALSNMGEQNAIDRVIYFYVDEEELVSRIAGRRSCSACQAIYHAVNHPPRVEGVCDDCGASLTQRKDDHSDTVRERLRVYKNETAPLIQYYEKQGRLSQIDANSSVDAVERCVREAACIITKEVRA